MAHAPTLQRVAAGAVVAAALLLAGHAGASPSWTAPAQLSGAGIALEPEPAVGSAGDTLVVWDQELGDVCADQPANPACVHVVEVVTRPVFALSWPAPIEIARPGVGSRPLGALDPAGDAIVVWVHDIGDNRVLQASYRRGRSSDWPEPTDLSEVTPRIGAHAAALDTFGNATVVWAGIGGDGKATVYAKERRAASGVWGAPIALSRPDGDAPGGPSLAVDGAGDAVVAWTAASPSGRVVQAVFRTASSGVWSAPVDLSAPGAELDPSVAIDYSGNAVAVWSRGSVESAYRPAGGTWGNAVAVSRSLAGRRDPRVALDTAGNAVAVWPGESEVESAARTRQTAVWSPPVKVGEAPASPPDLALDSFGNAVAAWANATGTTRAALRPAASGRWLPPTTISEQGASTSAPHVVAGAAGSMLVAWNRARPAGQVVEAVDFAGEGPLLLDLRVPATGTARVATRFSVSPVPWHRPLTGSPTWTFGDGGSGAGDRISHAYRGPGRYTVTVTQTDAAGGSTTASSSIVIRGQAPRSTTPPAVLGSPRVGSTLTCARGSWTGTPPIRYAYGWLRDGRPIPRAASQRYRARQADAGALVSCRVVATNAAGSREATSRARRIR